MKPLRLVNVSIDHPDAGEKLRGEGSRVALTVVNDEAKSRPMYRVPLSEDELVKLIADAARALATLKGVRVGVV